MFDGYNAGVLLLSPNGKIFDKLVEVAVSGEFVKTFAEQGVLNTVFHDSNMFLELPQDYNYNVVCETSNTTVRGSIDIKIIHYTTVKPFQRGFPWGCMWNTYDICLPWFVIYSI